MTIYCFSWENQTHRNFYPIRTGGPIRTPKILLMIHRTATRLRSPPRLVVEGVARAKVRLRAAKDRLRWDDIPDCVA